MSEVRRTRSDGRETITLIKKHAHAELEKHGAINFNLDRVLENSGVSRSSVYHHFGSRDSLVAVVSLEQSLARIIKELDVVAELANHATTPSEMFDVLVIGITAANDAAAKARRMRRISGFVATDNNPTLHVAIKEAQVEGTGHLIRLLSSAAERNLIFPTVPIEGIAYMIQSLLVGRIVVDVTDSGDLDDMWLEAALTSMRALLNG